VAQDVPLRVPRLYYGSLRPETGECLLLLEDLAPAQTLNILDGCTAEDAAFVLGHLAAFHAALWEHPRLRLMDWLPAFDEQAENDQRQYAHSWDVFIEKVRGLLPDGIAPLGARLKHHVAAVKQYLGREPQTLLHGDFHLHNILFGHSSEERALAVIDWQACSRGRAVRDVAHFLVTGFVPESRRAHELALLRQYHTALTERGVESYSFDQCLHDYRFTMLEEVVFLVMVLAHMDFTANETVIKIRDMAIERICGAVIDHNAGDLLQG